MPVNWRDKLSEATIKNSQAAWRRWAERNAIEWAASPYNPSAADHMYRQTPIREPDSTRQHVSPLGGIASPMQPSGSGSGSAAATTIKADAQSGRGLAKGCATTIEEGRGVDWRRTALLEGLLIVGLTMTVMALAQWR